MSPIPPFETTLAVPMTCESCITEIRISFSTLPGVTHISTDLPSQLVAITGNAAPSSLVTAIQSTGRDAILRGTGKDNSAAVCILETHATTSRSSSGVRGLVRMVQVAPDLVLVDASVRGVGAGEYFVTLRASGDISAGPERTGAVYARDADDSRSLRGVLGAIQVGASGSGAFFIDRPIAIWEMIGRAMVVSRERDGPFRKEDPDTLVGVVARSAGVWDNDKTVCSCSGKTVWEERAEQVGKGMM